MNETRYSSIIGSNGGSAILQQYTAQALTYCVENSHSLIAAFVATTLTILFTTRIITGQSFKAADNSSAVNGTIPTPPYWVPYLAHVVPSIFNFQGLLRRGRDGTRSGVTSFNFLGSPFVMIFSPSLMKSIFAQRVPTIDSNFLVEIALGRMFGTKRKHMKDWTDAIKPLNACIMNGLLKEPELSRLVDVTARRIEVQVPDMISFGDSPIDQSLWERVADVDVVQGAETPTVEANLFPLIRYFVGYVSSPSLFGQAFVDNYPTFLQDIYDLDGGLPWLILGFPRWVPIRSLSKAYNARHRLLKAIAALQEALDNEAQGTPSKSSEWRDLDDVSHLIQSRNKVFREETKLAPIDRACGDMSLLWAMNANVNNLVFWMLVRILATPGLVDRLREEIKSHCLIVQREKISALPEIPQIKISVKGLTESCPLLKACYLEALRLDSAPWSVKRINQDFKLQADSSDVMQSHPHSFQVQKGTLVGVPHVMHHKDPKYFEDPERFVPERFIKPSDEAGASPTVDGSGIRPYGGGSTMCKGRIFAERESFAFIAGFLSLWEFEAIGASGWEVPGHNWATGVQISATPYRVRISRRKI